MQPEFIQIESPLANFNNYIYKICQELSLLFDTNMTMNNDIIFDNNSILLFKFANISGDSELSININFIKPITEKNIKRSKLILDNFYNLERIYYKYMSVFSELSKNYDASITNGYIKSIISDIKISTKQNTLNDKLFFIPHYHKIAKDICDNETLKNLYNKFSYGLRLYTKETGNYGYSIVRLIASDLDESKCIANIRPLEIDIIAQGYVLKNNIQTFLTDLMFYGKLSNITKSTFE